MTPEQYNENLTKLYGLVSGDLSKDTILPAAYELLAAIKERISVQGKNTADGNIGNYSTEPIYACPSQFAKPGSFTPGGKSGAGKKVLKTYVNQADQLEHGRKFLPFLKTRKGKHYTQLKRDYSDYKSMYLAEGYQELRDVQGLRTDIVNFTYRGDLMESYQLQKISQYVVLGLTTELSVLKRQGLEKKFGDVFHATAQEKEAYISRANYSFLRITRNTIKGFDVTAEID